jgi:hypothetical protein
MTQQKKRFIIGNFRLLTQRGSEGMFRKGSLEDKALFLETTKESLIRAQGWCINKVKKGDDSAKERLKDIRKGIKEVDEKACILWAKITKEFKDGRRNSNTSQRT